MRDSLVVLLVLTFALVALRRPFFGLMGYVFIGILSPHSFSWGFARTFPLALIVASGIFIGLALSSESKRIPLRSETIILLLLWILFAISTIAAQSKELLGLQENAQDGFIFFSKIFLMWIASIVLITTQDRLKIFLKVIALSLGFFAVKGGFFAIISGGSQMVWGPSQSYLHSNNAIGLAMAMNVPLLYYLQKFEEKIWLRWIMRTMIVFSYPAVICTFSRGAWLGLVTGTGWIIFKHKFRAPLIILGCLGLLVGLLFLGTQFVPDRVVARFDDLRNYEEEGSAVSRFWNWEFCIRVGTANPFSGEGFNFYNTGAYFQYFPEFIEKYGSEKVWSCHSMWFTILAEHGVVAFLAWVFLWVSVFLSLRKIGSSSKLAEESPFILAVADMLKGAFLVCLVIGTFLDTAYFELIFSLIAVVVILKEISSRGQADPIVSMERN